MRKTPNAVNSRDGGMDTAIGRKGGREGEAETEVGREKGERREGSTAEG